MRGFSYRLCSCSYQNQLYVICIITSCSQPPTPEQPTRMRPSLYLSICLSTRVHVHMMYYIFYTIYIHISYTTLYVLYIYTCIYIHIIRVMLHMYYVLYVIYVIYIIQNNYSNFLKDKKRDKTENKHDTSSSLAPPRCRVCQSWWQRHWRAVSTSLHHHSSHWRS